MTWQTARLGFDADHPTASGHFPGNPMIPGALMLDAIIAAIAGPRCDAPMLIRSAKFLHIVRPGDDLDLRWQNLPDGSIKFECLMGGTLVLSGALVVKAAA